MIRLSEGEASILALPSLGLHSGASLCPNESRKAVAIKNKWSRSLQCSREREEEAGQRSHTESPGLLGQRACLGVLLGIRVYSGRPGYQGNYTIWSKRGSLGEIAQHFWKVTDWPEVTDCSCYPSVSCYTQDMHPPNLHTHFPDVCVSESTKTYWTSNKHTSVLFVSPSSTLLPKLALLLVSTPPFRKQLFL